METSNQLDEKKIIIIDSQEGVIRIADPDTLRELVYNLECQDHKYFVYELN